MSTPSVADPEDLDTGAEGDESSVEDQDSDSNGELDDSDDSDESESDGSGAPNNDELNATQREYLRREHFILTF